jgi:2-polyprenyl-6-methoxyphenol hydroxylase-like FAD-dependent oxidoreductase
VPASDALSRQFQLFAIKKMPQNQSQIDTRVIVVGAGPVGLSMAIELGSRGIPVVLLEQRIRTGAQPRAKTTNVRTMQHLRRWGVADALRAAAPLPYDYPTDVVFATTLFGHTISVIENAFEGAKRRDPRFPEPAQWVPQYTLEKVLHQRIGELASVRLMSGTVLEDAAQSPADVRAAVSDTETGKRFTIRADYLVGADGARSRVRETIGAAMVGEHAYAYNYNVIVRVPELESNPPTRRAIMYWLLNQRSPGVIAPLDRGGMWAFGMMLPPGIKEIEEADVVRLVQTAIGRPLHVEIVTADLWAAHRLIADKYRDRRIFLAGDACHLHPPFGGYGMNLGVGDAVDLGWKLAGVLEGWADDGILGSYEAERRPVHLRTVAEAVENYKTLSNHLLKDDLDDDTAAGEAARSALAHEIVAAKSREFKTLGVVLGTHYASSPINADEDTPLPEEHTSDYQPCARPGCLAPHAWLADGSSLYDHFGQGFSLLLLDEAGTSAAGEIASVMKTMAVPVKLIDLRHADLARLYEAPLALIRPDQYVAWRGATTDVWALVDRIRGVETKTMIRRTHREGTGQQHHQRHPDH